MNSDATGEVVIPFKKAKIVKQLFVGALMVAASVGVYLLPVGATPYPSWILRGLGVVGVAFFGAGSIVYIAQFIARRAGLTIDREGLIDRTTYAGVGRVRWSEISGLRIVSVRNVAFLIVDVYDPQEFVGRGNAFQRFLRASNARMVGSPVSLAATSLSADFDQVVQLIEQGCLRAAAGS